MYKDFFLNSLLFKKKKILETCCLVSPERRRLGKRSDF